MKFIQITFIFFALLICNNQIYAQKDAYQIFDSNGKRVKYKNLFKRASNSDVIFFGEYHNNPISHWLQFELFKDLHLSNYNLQVGAEMFERHQQWAIDLYFEDKIKTKTFEDTIKLWPNYKTDYKPILEYAKMNNIDLYSTNIPRKYARMVYKTGMKSVIDNDTIPKEQMAPLPIEIDYELPSYKNMMSMMGGHGDQSAKDFVAAQAIKDATMAYFISKNYKENFKFFHLNGSYHSDYKEGIIWYLKKSKPNLAIINITTAEQTQLKKLDEENKDRADYIIVVPESMTKTY